MPRQPRIKVAHHAQLARHTGHNGREVFSREADYREYIDALWDASVETGTHIHAYVLMRKTVVIFCTPTTSDGLPRLMQDVGRRYAGYFNRRYDHSGTIWNDRYRACLVEASRALDVYRYVDCLPVRAGYVDDPTRWHWSSAIHNLAPKGPSFVTPHLSFSGLDATAAGSRSRYGELTREPLSQAQWDEIDSAVARGHAVGSDHYKSRLEAMFNRPFRPGKPGRPRKQEEHHEEA